MPMVDPTSEDKRLKYSRSLDSLCQFGSHTGVHLYSSAVLCFLQYSYCKISGTWTNFEDFVRWSKICLSEKRQFQ